MARFSFVIVLSAMLTMGCGMLHTDGSTDAVQIVPTFEDPSRPPEGNTVLSSEDGNYYLGVKSKICF